VIRIAKKKMPYLQCINSRFMHNDSRLKNTKNAGFSRCDAAWQELLSCMHRDDGKHACRCITGHHDNLCTPASINGKPYLKPPQRQTVMTTLASMRQAIHACFRHVACIV
jgi:hypothetical protein